MVASKALNLATDRWIPVTTRSGATRLIAPWELTADIESDPVTDLDIGRPEMRGAALEFMIGLYSSAFSLEHESWRALWTEAPTPEVLKKAFAVLSPAFDLDGSTDADHPRFMQQREPFAADCARVDMPDSLLMGGATENAKSNRTDWLVKGCNVTLSRPAAALALIAQQLYCHGGGNGYYASMRKIGPLSTVVVPVRGGVKMPLYWQIMANVRPGGGTGVSEEIFPWLGLTGVEVGEFRLLTKSSSPNVDEIQCFWPMTRRIRLNFRKAEAGERCSILGIEDDWVLENLEKANGGLRYDDSGWRHPLSPYEQRINKETKQSWITPVLAQSNRIAWPNYLGQVVAGQRAGMNRQEPATAVASASGVRSRYIGKFAVHAYGACITNTDLDVWTEGVMPSHQGADAEATRLVEQAAIAMIHTGDLIAGALGDAVRKAIRSRSGFSSTLAKQAVDSFWVESEAAFHEALEAIGANKSEAWSERSRMTWFYILKGLAWEIFDRTAPMTDAINGKCKVNGSDGIVLVVEAHKMLRKRLSKYGDVSKKAFEILGLSSEPKAAE